MTQAPNLLNDDGTASIATAMMLSHHAFRRDLRRFSRALEQIAAGERARASAVAEEWKQYRLALHGHHEMEDTAIFPGIAAEHAHVRATVEGLSADHRRIDPLLERGDRAFADLSQAEAALEVVRELEQLLTPHLALEEAELVPFLRMTKEFPAPPNDEVAELYAQGFSWSMDGIAEDVLERVRDMLPEILLTKLPAARKAFEARCLRTWGVVKRGASRTPVPDES
jgi:hemerythrin-like domain-containing protein